MIGKIFCIGVLLPMITFSSYGQEQNTLATFLPAGSQPSVIAPAEHFTGKAWVTPLFPADKTIDVSAAYVTFEPGARTAWHSHPNGQRLIVISGVGLTQQEGQPVQIIHPGDVVVCPPGVKHWHGAAPGSAMTQLAITGSLDGKNVEWMQKVTDTEYLAIHNMPGARPLATNDTSVTEHVPAISHQQSPSNTLSQPQQAIVLIASSMASSQMAKLNDALNQGLDAGLTISEAKEILVQLYAYTGFPRSLNALNELMKISNNRKQRGIKDIQGEDPITPIPVGNELQRVGMATQSKIAGAVVQGPLFEFVPVINQFLQTHLFGDIFSRDNLDWQSRELATVGALAATPGVEAQLVSHMQASLRMGLTTGQLEQLIQLLRAHAEYEASMRADHALHLALAK